jgi:ribosomal protein S3
MGQKTNPTILRIGNLNEWKSKYIKKKPTESPTMIFRDLEIRKFIYQLFSKNGLSIQNFKMYYSESALHVYISYYNAIKLTGLNEKAKTRYSNVESKLLEKTITQLRQNTLRKQIYRTKAYKTSFMEPLQMKMFQKHYLLSKKSQRSLTAEHFKNYIKEKAVQMSDYPNKDLFTSKILKGLSLFTCKKQNIFLNLRQTNKETILLQALLKQNRSKLKESIIKLRKFQQNEFFKKGVNILFTSLNSSQSSLFLAEFIALYLRKLKRPNFFLRFLKLTLTIMISGKFSQLERVQIKIKGRFNGAPRSTHKFVNVGKNIPVSTFNAQINFGETTAYTANGSFGIKVWTYKNN